MSPSVFQCAGWLRSFLQRRGLDAADQRSLYDYHCSYEEYLQLRQLLKGLGGCDLSFNDLNASASLVLFCSEWYRREYQREHSWSWNPIWRELGYRLPPSDLSKAIPAGLERYWKRPIHLHNPDRRDLLGTVFSEGGLPFQALREGGSRFQTLFNRVLKQYEEGHLIGNSTSQLIKAQLKKISLPKVFSSPSSVELMAHMADQLISLVRDYDLAQAEEPVVRLDTMNPKWRGLFPLPLDNETGSELLNGLLNAATTETRKSRKTGSWSCHHFWQATRPDELKVHISLPSEVVFHLSSQPSTTRFELAIWEQEAVLASLGAGYAVIDQGVARIRLRQQEVIAVRHDCSVALRLVAMTGGLVLGSVPIEGSALGMGEVPVGFERRDDRWKLCGQASFSTPSEEVLVVLPVDASLQTVDGTGGVVRVIEESFFSSLRVLRVQGQGEFRVTTQDDSTFYRLRTGDVSGTGLGVVLVGSEIAWPAKPVITFVGLPKVQWGNAISELNAPGGDLFVGGRPAGIGVLQENLGAQYVSVRNCSGDILLRRKIGILPADFQVELRSGESPKHGSILVFTKHRCILQVAQDGVEVRQIKKEGHIELQLSAGSLPPTRLRLLVTPNLAADPIELDLPFPSSGCVAVNRDGRPLARDVCIDDLLGARLYLFRRPGIATSFNLDIGLLGSVARNVHYRWTYTGKGKPVEVRLFNIREQIFDLLSLHEGIDQVVDLRVSALGQEFSLRVRRYSQELSLDSARQVLRPHVLLSSTKEQPEAALMLLHDPMRHAVDLLPCISEGVTTGELKLPPEVGKDGPWLVIPKVDSPVSFRPLFLPGCWEFQPAASEVQTLQKAVRVFDHTSTESSFTAVLDAMASNPSHSGWQFLRSLYDGYGNLPLATFEVWKAVVAHPKALSMALFRFDADPNFLSRLEGEFPILWELQLPIKDVHNTVNCFHDFLLNKGVSEAALANIISRMLGRIGETFTSYGENVQSHLSNLPLGPEISIPHDVLIPVVRGWYMELIRGRSEVRWPEYGGEELKAWHDRQGDSVISFDVEMSYRYAVVYFPVFAAAVASGQAKLSDVFADTSEAVFFLRQVRDFDRNWFNVIYQQSLLRNVMNIDKAVQNNG